jgi:hypothetical protein
LKSDFEMDLRTTTATIMEEIIPLLLDKPLLYHNQGDRMILRKDGPKSPKIAQNVAQSILHPNNYL